MSYLGKQLTGPGDPAREASWDAEAHFTNANYQSKKLVLLLFINRELPVLVFCDSR